MATKYKSQAKYDANNTIFIGLKLNLKTDKEIVEWLDKQPSRQGSIKSALKEFLKNGGN